MDINEDRIIKKIRKKLRQIENLLLLDRELNEEEQLKVDKKASLRSELSQLLKAQRQAANKLNVQEDKKLTTDDDLVDLYQDLTLKEKVIGDLKNKGNDESPIVEIDKEINNLEENKVNITPTICEKKEVLEIQSSNEEVNTANKAKLNQELKNEQIINQEVKVPSKSNERDIKFVPTKKKTPDVNKAISTNPRITCIQDSSYDSCILDGHNDLITKVLLHTNFIISASRDSTVKVWDVSTGKELQSLRGHRGYVTALAVLPETLSTLVINGLKEKDECIETTSESVYIISGGQDCSIYMWDVTTGKSIHTVYTYNGITCLTCHESGVVSGTDGGKIEVWDLHSSSLKHYLNAFTGPIVDIIVNGDKLAAASTNGELGVFMCNDELEELTIQYLMEHESIGYISLNWLACFANKSNIFYLGDSGANIKVLDTQTGIVCRIRNHNEDFGMTDSMLITPDNYLIASSYDLDYGCSSLNVWDSTSGSYICSLLVGDNGRVLTLAAERELQKIVTGGIELKLWSKKRKNSQVTKSCTRVLTTQSLNDKKKIVETDTEVESECMSSSDEEDENYPNNEKVEQASSWWCNVL